MKYAIIDNETVSNIIEASLPGAISLIRGGMTMVQCMDKPVCIGDSFDESSGRFYRTVTDMTIDPDTGEESPVTVTERTIEVVSPALTEATEPLASAATDAADLAVDHEFRLTLLELGVTE